jgi:hypothetical protein
MSIQLVLPIKLLRSERLLTKYTQSCYKLVVFWMFEICSGPDLRGRRTFAEGFSPTVAYLPKMENVIAI